MAGKPVEFTPRQVEEMELSFSRGFSMGWLHGCDHKECWCRPPSSAKRGVLIGQVHDVRKGRVRVELYRRLKAGDGLVFEGDRAAGEEQGGRVFTVSRNGRRVTEEVSSGLVELTFHADPIDLKRIWVGQKVWKSDDPALTRRLRKSFTGEITGRDVPVQIQVTAGVGRPLRIEVQAEGLSPFACLSDEPLAEAIKHPLTRETLAQQLGRLGGSGFALVGLTASIEGTPMVPLSVLGKLRRELVTRLAAARDTALHRRQKTAAEPVLPPAAE